MLVFSAAALLAASAFGQARPFGCSFFRPLALSAMPQTAKLNAAQAATPRANSAAAGSLNQVLALLDRTSEKFKSAQADFVWDQYQKVVDEHDIQKGVIYFRRAGSNVDVAADIQHAEGSDHRKLLFTGSDVKIYSYRTHQATNYPAGKNREEVESFLALGFGGRASDLQKNFELRYAGTETIDGRPTYKLELTPKSQRVQGMFRMVTLWIDQQTGMSLQQKAMEGQYDYRLAKYPFASMKLNQKIPSDAFKLP
jgi:outer membrane lipoprotein-sorting protein